MYYRNDQDQLSLEEFFLPFGGRLLRDNRWVRLAGLMPWEYIEEVYAQNMSGKPAARPFHPGSRLGPFSSRSIVTSQTRMR